MANLNVTVNPNKRYSSWFHPMWRKNGSIYVNSTTTESIELGGTFTVDYGHGWASGNNYAQNAEVEVTGAGAFEFDFYRSLQDNNQNHSPATSPTWWELITSTSYLGADDEFWHQTPGLLRPDIGYEFYGYHSIHLFARAGGIAGANWASDPITGGQFAEVVNASNPAPAVRMTSTDDTCYWGTVSVDTGDVPYFVTANLYKTISGTTTLIGTTSYETLDAGSALFGVFAQGSTIGVSRALSTTGSPGWQGFYNYDREICLTVTDTSISVSAGPYVGVRATAAAGANVHEWYGGEYGLLTSDQSIAGSTVTLSGLRRPGSTVTVTET